MPISKNRFWESSEVNSDLHLADGSLYWKSGPRKGKKAGWLDRFGYQNIRYKGVLVKEHNLVWLMTHGHWPDKEIDHKDNDGQNNSVDNLREACRSNQGMNQKLQERRKGKFKGVHQSSSGNFYVKIKREGKQHYCGSYSSEQEAAMIYNISAEKLFGEFAHLNKVFEDTEGN